MIKRFFSFYFLFALLSQLAAPGVWGQPPAQTPPQPLAIRSSDAGGMVIEINLPPFQTETITANGFSCQRIHLDGWGQLGNPGQPGVPFKGELVGLPPLGGTRLTVLETGAETVVENFNLCPVATLAPVKNPDADFQGTEEYLIADPAAYQDPDQRPEAWAVLDQPANLRSQRIARLRLQPFHYQAADQRLRYTSRLVVRVEFDAQPVPLGSWIDEGPYETILQNALINYPSAKSWRKNTIQTSANQTLAANPSPAVQLAVSKDSIYRVTYTDLQAKNVPVGTPGLDPRTFRLLINGAETAIRVIGQDDGSFDAGDELLFYGQKNESRYTNSSIYWLTWGGADGARIANQDGSPGTGEAQTSFISTIRADVNLSYLNSIPSGPEQDRWYWSLIAASSATKSSNFLISLPHVSSTTAPGTTAVVRGLLQGYAASPQHHTRIYFNDTLIQDATWPAKDEWSFEAAVPHSALLPDNTIKVECVLGDGTTLDYTLVNWFEVEYLRDYAADSGTARFHGDQAGAWIYEVPGFSGPAAEIWDITQPLIPKGILNAVFTDHAPDYTLRFYQNNPDPREYLAVENGSLPAPDSITAVQPSGLRSTALGADYILITHPDFLAEVQPLAAYHTARGLRVQVVNVYDIYNEFGAGFMDAEAIRSFLAYAYTSWTQPAPSYVLLVGDGNYDFKNFRGMNEANYVPPYLADVDPWMGEVAADNQYVSFDSDSLPAMALGRLPVKTVDQARTVVQKILEYPQNISDDWDKQVLVVADRPDNAGDFPALAEMFADQLPERFTTEKVYLPAGVSSTSPVVIAARESILDGINAGRIIVHYTGHSSAYAWSGVDLMRKQSIPALTNVDRLPFFLSMTCFVGYYITPSGPTFDASGLDEVLVRAANGGAIATWSPTGEGISLGHSILDTGLIEAIFSDHMPQIGLSTTQAKYYLYANSTNFHEFINTYLLMGDPALKLPVDFNVYLPSTSR